MAHPPHGATWQTRRVSPPVPSEARVLVDPIDAGHVDVVVRGTHFCYRKDREGQWRGGCAVVTSAQGEIDEHWLGKARELAEAKVLAREGGAKPRAPEPLRCPHCEAVLYGPGLDELGPDVVHVLCGPEHVVRWRSGRHAVVAPGGDVSIGRPDELEP